jgi:sortase A
VFHKKRASLLGLAVLAVLTLTGAAIFFWNPWDVLVRLPAPDLTNQSTTTPRFRDFGIEIPKIKVSASVTSDVDGNNEELYNESLKNGLAHYKGSALPGARGNIFIFGHSSNVNDSGPYAKIFSKLNDLSIGDTIKVTYKDKVYSYIVSEKRVVNDTDTSPLNLTTSEQLTLMTCWPVGTTDKRLIIIAK